MSGQADGMADDGKRAVRNDTSNKSLTCHEPLESIFSVQVHMVSAQGFPCRLQ